MRAQWSARAKAVLCTIAKVLEAQIYQSFRGTKIVKRDPGDLGGALTSSAELLELIC